MNTKTTDGWCGMPAEEFPDHASGVRDLDKRAGLLPVVWVLAGVSAVIIGALVVVNL